MEAIEQRGAASKDELGLAARRIQQRLIVEELTRRRASDDYERYLETFRRATVDANPHQIEAVVFALNRLSHGGALLCDEVGLGKTIEAGLVLSELRARGAERILVIVPLSLGRQWQVELEDLFSIPSVILEKSNFEDHDEKTGVFIVGREFASTESRASLLRERGPWDLIIVDEAHELLGGLYKRFRCSTGAYNHDLSRGHGRRAGWLKFLIEGTPTLLLTATPLQNNLFELWSLVHFLDQENTILGPFDEFAALYVNRNGREIKPERLEPLKSRLSEVVCRSLRHQVSPFLKVPFVKRTCETMDFSPPGQQSELYTAVTRWLARPDMVIYRFSARALTTLQVRRRMGSSPRALLYNINTMFERASELMADPEKRGNRPLHLIERDMTELQNLKRLAERANQQPDPKLRLLLRVLDNVSARARASGASDKLVVFTESKQTLKAIVKFLAQQGMTDQVTTFSGDNVGSRAEEALDRWMAEVGASLSAESRPGPEACQRAALVHEFRTRTRVLVATEAGAKGLNLQFCSCLVNYDLPWNPQRLEQRIGRIHRYGQTHDVVIFNFVNMANDAERRVYSLLKDKLHLFEGLFGASDEILGLVASSLDLERRIDQLLRTSPNIGIAFDELENEIAAMEASCAGVRAVANQMLGTLRPDVQARLKGLGETFAGSLSRFDENLLQLLALEDESLQVGEDESLAITIATGSRHFRLGGRTDQDLPGEPLHLEHPYLVQLLARVKTQTEGRAYTFSGKQSGCWQVSLARFSGLEAVEQLFVIGPSDLCQALREATPRGVGELAESGTESLQAAMQQARETLESQQQGRAKRKLRLIEGRESDLQRFWKQEEAELIRAVEKARTAQRMARDAKEMQKAQAEVKKLKTRLTQHQNQQRQRLAELRERLRQERDGLHESKFMTTEAKLLFTVTIEDDRM